MPAGDCIRLRGEAGELEAQRADELGKLADSLERQMRAQGALPHDAESRAIQIAQSAWENGLRAKKTLRFRQAAVQATLRDFIDSFPVKERANAARSLLIPDYRGKFNPLNLERLIGEHQAAAHSVMTDFISRARSTHAGFVQDKALSQDVVREIIDGAGASNNRSAQEVAGGVNEMFEYYRKQLIRMGLPIAKVEGFVPQKHSMLDVRAAGEAEWVNFLTPLLRRDKMINRNTGQPFTDKELTDVLRKTYRNISTGGMDTIKPGKPRQESVLQKLDRERFLLFKDADSWLTYAERFGATDYWSTITGYSENMARDVARVQLLGPQPSATIRAINQVLERAAKEIDPRATRPLGEGEVRNVSFQVLYDEVIGANQSLSNAQTLSKGGEIIRAISLSATLGSAYFSAITDFGFAKVAASMSGLPYLRVIGRMAKTFRPGSPADARAAIRAGLTAQGWISQAIGAQRLSGEVITTEWARRMTDTVLRLGLLSPHTDALRWSFGQELMGWVTENLARSFDELPAPLRESMARVGMNASEWNTIRATKPFRDPETGATWLRPMDIAAEGNETAASRLFTFIQNEIEAAVPTSNARARAILRAGTQKGTLLGEVVRTAGLLKQFPVSIMAVQFARAAAFAGERAARTGGSAAAGRAIYFAHLVIASTMMATIGETMSQITRGRFPEALANPTDENIIPFLKSVGFRAGAAGLIGDFIFSDINNEYRLTNFFLGPAIGGTGFGAIKLTAGNIMQAAADEDTDIGRESVRFVQDNLPGGRLWFTRIALERILFDEIQRLVDPNAEASFRRQRAFSRDKLGSKYFIRPGKGIEDIF